MSSMNLLSNTIVSMSLNDHFVLEKGAKLEQLKKLDEAAVTLFKEITKLGFKLVD